jgi:hypothetical protein
MWIKCSETFVVSLVVSFVGSSNCSRIDKAYDKVYDKVSFFMQKNSIGHLAGDSSSAGLGF